MQGLQKQGHGQQIRAAAGGEIALDELPVQLGDLLQRRHAPGLIRV